MNIESAIILIDQLIYKPGWKFEATDHTNRFEGSVKVRITYPAPNTNRDNAKNGYCEQIVTYAEFPMIVQTIDDVCLYRKIANAIIEIETHEMREALRILPTYWAPFHPHQIDGMKRWDRTESFDPSEDIFPDLRFGIA
jgi:hypothetical protein